MPQISIAHANNRPIALSLSMDGWIIDKSEKSTRFFMGIGIRALKEFWDLYQSEKRAA